MSQLIDGSNTASATEEQTSLSQTYTFNTIGSFVEKNIKLTVEVPGVNLNNGDSFYINDGIYTWNWQIDSSGNVTIF